MSPIKIIVEPKSGMRQLFMHEIPFEQITGDKGVEIVDFSNKTEFFGQMSLKFQLTYAPNKPAQLQAQIALLKYELKDYTTLMQQVKIFIQQLSSPFGFLNKQIADIQTNMAARRESEWRAEQMGDHRFH